MGDVAQLFKAEYIQANAQKRASAHSFLLDDIADRLLDRLKDVNRKFLHVAILGHVPDAILKRFPKADRVDFFEEKRTHPEATLPGQLALPKKDYDLIISVTGLHRVNDPVGALIQINRALKPDGLALLGLFAGETLKELRRGLIEAEMALSGRASQRVHPFADIRDLGSLLQRADFALPVADIDLITVRYSALQTLLKDLRGMGEGLALKNRPKTTPKELFKRLEVTYPKTDNAYLATFEVAFLTGWHPHESQQKPLAPGSGKVSLADALKPTKNIKKVD